MKKFCPEFPATGLDCKVQDTEQTQLCVDFCITTFEIWRQNSCMEKYITKIKLISVYQSSKTPNNPFLLQTFSAGLFAHITVCEYCKGQSAKSNEYASQRQNKIFHLVSIIFKMEACLARFFQKDDIWKV